MALTTALFFAGAVAHPHVSSPPGHRNLNGLNDRLFKESGPCVQNCLVKYKSIDMTPCSIRDTGCLCLFLTYNDIWMSCVLEVCPQFAKDAAARGTATCKRAGVHYEEALAFSDPVLAGIGNSTSQVPTKPRVEGTTSNHDAAPAQVKHETDRDEVINDISNSSSK